MTLLRTNSREPSPWLTLWFVTALAGCGDEVSGKKSGAVCTWSGDCSSPLVCELGRCRKTCRATSECSPMFQCVAVSQADRVCELPGDVRTCTESFDCRSPLLCASDKRCRAPCREAADCADGQLCTGATCVEPSELDGGRLGVIEADAG